MDSTLDCAVASIDARSGASCEIVDIGNITGTSTSVNIGDLVRKRGRSTRVTFGDIESKDQTITIRGQTFFHQIGIEPDLTRNNTFGEDGDSGVVVVNGSSEVIGLYWGGSGSGHGSANPIQSVLNALNISMCA